MKHRTDTAGTVGCRMGQLPPGNDGMRRHRSNFALIEKNSSKNHPPEASAYSLFGGTKCNRRFMTAIPSAHAVYVDAPGPIKRRHHNTAKLATTSRSNKHDRTGRYEWLFMHDILLVAPRWRWPLH